MTEKNSLWLLLPQPLRNLPADMAVLITILLFIDICVMGPRIGETPARTVGGFIFVVFVPGYALLAALFPERDKQLQDSGRGDLTARSQRRGISWLERVVLSVGLSLALIPLLVLVVSFTPWGIAVRPILVIFNVFTILSIGIATYRRQSLPEERRFRTPYRKWLIDGEEFIFGSDTHVDRILTFVLVISIVLGGVSVVYGISAPPQGETHSTVSLLTETDTEELIAGGYPTNAERGDELEFVLHIDNNEKRTAEYTVVIVEQAMSGDSGELFPAEQRELRRIEVRIPATESRYQTHTISPTLTGDTTRIQWLIYVDDVPDHPSPKNAEYTVHHSMNVTD